LRSSRSKDGHAFIFTCIDKTTVEIADVASPSCDPRVSFW